MTSRMSREELGRRIRQAREDRGMSQEALGRLLTRPRTHAAVSDIERGKTKLDVEDLAELATLLRRNLSYFYGSEPAPTIVYHRGDRDLAPHQLRETNESIEAFKQFAREQARRRQIGGSG